MATNVSYPGVYIEEVPSGVRTIAGVATSIAAFVGFTARGPVNRPVRIFSFADFEREFGGLDLVSDLSYSVSHFFLNGGTTAWIVRVAAGAAAAAIDMEDAFGGGGNVVLTATAFSAGTWGNNLRLIVDFDTSNPASLFNLKVAEVAERNGRLQELRSEVHRNLSMNGFAPNFAVDVVNASSNLIRLERPGGLTFGATNGTATNRPIDAAALALLGDNARRLAITLDGGRTYEFDFMNEGDPLAGGTFALNMADLAARIETAVRALEPANPVFSAFTCTETNDGTVGALTATSGTPPADRERSSVGFASASRRNAAGILSLGVANGGREQAAAAAVRPVQSGTVWIRQDPATDFTTLVTPGAVDVDLLDSAGTVLHNAAITLWSVAGDRPADLPQLRTLLQAGFNGVARPEFAGARVLLADQRLVFIPGGDNPAVRFRFNSGPSDGAIDLSTNAEPNVAAYQLGIGPALQAQSGAVPGADGTPPSAIDLAGSRLAKTGLFALEDVNLFNILLIPNQSDPSLLGGAIAYAEERRAFVLLDLPATIDTLDEATNWLTSNAGLRHRNAAAYFPRARFADPLQANRVRSFANSGAVAGVYARTDGTRGVWKAPAGIEAGLRGARGLDYVLTDPENGVINPLGLNALRSFPAFGTIAWGARTLLGSDALASEWKYVPVRRLALFIEESLYRGTQWVVFEPNDEPLWAQIRLNVGAFMNNLFRQGALQGASPRDAYLVKCDSTTTTQDDINLGIVNIIVGFAPLKPAEFVIIKVQQLAGQAGAGA
jgi:Bacteriophage tail sheath protein